MNFIYSTYLGIGVMVLPMLPHESELIYLRIIYFHLDSSIGIVVSFNTSEIC